MSGIEPLKRVRVNEATKFMITAEAKQRTL